MSIQFLLQSIADKVVREAFHKIQDYINNDPLQLGGFQFFTYTFAGAVTKKAIPHTLGYIPMDVLLLSVTSPDTSTVTFHYDSFTSSNLYITTSAACTLRAYVGRYRSVS